MDTILKIVKAGAVAVLFILIFAGYGRAFPINGTININGTLQDNVNGDTVGGATLTLMGSSISATTNSEGQFTLSGVPKNSVGIMIKISGGASNHTANYETTYTPLTSTQYAYINGWGLLTMNTAHWNTITSEIGHTTGTGVVSVDIRDTDNNPLEGATVSAYYLGTNTSVGNPVYCDLSGPNGTLTSTGNDNGIGAYFPNVTPDDPIMIKVSAGGYTFPVELAVAYPDSLTNCEGTFDIMANTAGSQSFSGTLSDITNSESSPVDSGATVSITGTNPNIHTTTGSDGSFSFSSLQFDAAYPDSSYVVETSKPNYIDTYQYAFIDESTLTDTLNIMPQFFYTALENSSDITHINNEGDFLGQVTTQDGYGIAGAAVSLVDKNGNAVSGLGPYYADENNFPDSPLLTSTTSAGSFLFVNLSPGIYWTTASKTGFEFPINGVVIFSNGITIGQLATDTPVGSLYLSPAAVEPPAASILDNASNETMLQFNLLADPNAEDVTVDTITFTLMPASTGTLSAISSAHLLFDINGNGSFATDFGAGTISGSTITFGRLNTPVGIGSSDNNYTWEVLFNFNGTAATGQTFGLEIARDSDIGSIDVDSYKFPITTTSQNSPPVTGNMMTIAAAAPPAQPTNSSPSNGATGVDPANYTLTASSFNPGAGNTTQTASEWQIRQIDDVSYDAATADSTIISNFTTIVKPIILASNTTYYWRVRYENGASVWSSYSAETSFITGSGGYIPPAQPINSDPTYGETEVSVIPTLQASAFSGGSSSTQTASDWQIRIITGNYTNPVYDSGVTTSGLTSIAVPSASVLNYKGGNAINTYYWRVKYRDENNLWSPWSAETPFITESNALLSSSSGGIPVAPVAAGLSGLLAWLKKKKQK